MAVSRKTSFYKKHLVCPLCLDVFRDPRELPCLHTFCLPCLHAYVISATAATAATATTTSNSVPNSANRRWASPPRDKESRWASTPDSGSRRWASPPRDSGSHHWVTPPRSETGTPSGGFHCPVCRVHTAAPLHGLLAACWAQNYPPNYTVRDLVEETVKQGLTRKWEIPSTSTPKAGHEGNHKHLRMTHTHGKQADLTEKSEIVSASHSHPLNSSAASKDLTEKSHAKEKATAHQTLSRLRRSSSVANDNPCGSTKDEEVCSQQLASGRGLDRRGTVPNRKEERSLKEKAGHMTLKRLCDEKREQSDHSKADPSLFQDLGHLVPASSDSGLHGTLAANASTKHMQDGLADDLRDYLSINGLNAAPQQSAGPPVGHLNDIKEEDGDWREAEKLESVSRSQDKIYVRIRSDDRCCNVTGLATLPDGRLIIADEHNNNVKVFDSSGKYLTHIEFPSPPFDIDAIEECEAAVTCPDDRCLHVLFITNTLTVVRTIEFDKRCLGVSYLDLKFFVALETEIRVLTYEGELLQRFHRDPSKRKLLFSGKSPFVEACYVAADDHHIHVSDSAKRCVLTLNTKGEVVSSFKDGEYVKMLGVCRGPEPGSVFVCQWPNTLFLVHAAGEHGRHIRHVLVLDNIQAVHYDANTQQLWLSQATDNFVNQYSFKYK